MLLSASFFVLFSLFSAEGIKRIGANLTRAATWPVFRVVTQRSSPVAWRPCKRLRGRLRFTTHRQNLVFHSFPQDLNGISPVKLFSKYKKLHVNDHIVINGYEKRKWHSLLHQFLRRKTLENIRTPEKLMEARCAANQIVRYIVIIFNWVFSEFLHSNRTFKCWADLFPCL